MPVHPPRARLSAPPGESLRPKATWPGTGSLNRLLVVLLATWLPLFPLQGQQSPAAAPLFHRDIAPLLLQHCASCHQPGQAAPFSLLSYDDARKRARLLAEVTHRRLMPPWMPDPLCNSFLGERSLTPAQINLLQRWADSGAPEGPATNATPLPRPPEAWPLGTPDLIVSMEESFALPADGPDVYRNFVIALPNASRKFVRGLEFRPDNSRAIHHAFLRIDPTRESRRRDALEASPGFGGLHTPSTAQTPAGQFLSWQPGKQSRFVPDGLSWLLETNCDLVLQAHLRPTGKRENVSASIAFYFTDRPPTNAPFKIGLRSFDIDLPAGATNAVVVDTYELAADVDLLSVLPHAHYLGKKLDATASLPGGEVKCLLRIPEWDFNWQGEYLYAQPLFLPRGSIITMAWHFDNSTNNARNPHHPPRRARYGLQSTDEMAELWFQLLPRHRADTAALARYDQPRISRDSMRYNQFLLAQNTNDARAHAELGRSLLFLDRRAEARTHLRTAAKLDPALDEPHYFLGILHRMEGKPTEAALAFRAAVEINPLNAKAHGNLGLALLELGRTDDARRALETALRLNPQDQLARETLEEMARANRVLKK
jgi:tetratricopeptide (TPR) repeat protein